MDSWLQFFLMTGGLLILGGLIVLNGWFDDRRWKAQREAEAATKRTPAE